MEQIVIEKHMQKGNILWYGRYVGDVFWCTKKGTDSFILNEINKFDPGHLFFTQQKFENNNLIFLDTAIYLDEKTIQIKQYRKEQNSKVVTNWKNAVSPKKYKISELKGSIFRSFYTCSSEKELNVALKKLTDIYLENQYPLKIIESAIQEIKSRNFTAKNNKTEYQRLVKNNPDKYHTLILPFTARSCENIGYNLLRITKSLTPEYSLNVCWTTEKLARFCSPRLKLGMPPVEKIGCVYEFKCPGCDKLYIGETKRRLKVRIEEHNDQKHDSAISNHIYGECDLLSLPRLTDYLL